jgi:hypothetical protein
MVKFNDGFELIEVPPPLAYVCGFEPKGLLKTER